MVKYVEGRFDTDYNETIGVQFLEKQLNAAGTQIPIHRPLLSFHAHSGFSCVAFFQELTSL